MIFGKQENSTEATNETPAEETDQEGATPNEFLSVEELAEKLVRAQAETSEYLDNWRRATAELSNARKRMLREQTEFQAKAAARVLEKLVSIVDDVDRAFAALPPEQADSDWVNGFRLIQSKLHSLLENENVTAIHTEGQMFDPELHHALTHEVCDGFREGQIIAEVARGYRLGEKVLRPSMVRVAKDGPEDPA